MYVGGTVCDVDESSTAQELADPARTLMYGRYTAEGTARSTAGSKVQRCRPPL